MLDHYAQSPLFTPAERAALRWTEEMTRTPVDTPEEAFNELRRHFDAAQIVELTAMIAFENMRARFNRPLLIESDGFCRLPDNHPARIAAAD